ncbi:MAG: glycosyltransferase family A protein [Clostridia bacterium]|nr:glycosyltransferase family A protein [Clostridia bacterium]
MKLLTVVVPAYNMERWLERCLDSLDDVRMERFLEVVVVDDGSTDGTLKVARRFEHKCPSVFRVISQPNAGHGGAVNAGLAAATGKYFRIVDADDWVNPDALLAVLRRMSALDCDLFIDEKTEIDVLTDKVTRMEMPEHVRFGEQLPFDEVTKPEFARFLSMHTLSARTQMLRDMGLRLLEHTFYVDMQFVIAASALARTVCLMRERVYNYQVGNAEQSVFYLNYVKRYDQHDRVLRACIDFCDGNEERMPARRWAYMDAALGLLARSQLKIAMVFDPDKPQGRARARKLRAELRAGHPQIWRRARSRYLSALVLNHLGVGYEQLDRWMRMLRGRR